MCLHSKEQRNENEPEQLLFMVLSACDNRGRRDDDDEETHGINRECVSAINDM